ncbi:NAD-dependent epimerase/dehydratase family protein [Teichococcus oryzae]|uniref:NAD-dependent epimerase/dehydratase family protein n=1 Tax=Teichococcus oryzae TaxID=1608942 RepID=A0A5B2TEQ2_9PROT|nr:NAD-dependent epimerase/dehydratase family protein [Pseudoroseomonas oryzae]KAA2212583.1 NAD-dependent epimerase/dehydratase family protein [Pseudoroseomonas oryzae]
MRRILVTGAAGFIGRAVSARLAEDGLEVRGVDNFTSYYDIRLKEARLKDLEGRPGFSFLRLDLADAAATREAFADFKPDGVIHLAAQAGVRYSLENPSAYTSSNVDGFLSVLEACRFHEVRHLVYASSSSVYGGNTKVPFAEADAVNLPVSLYAATKRANELMAQTYSHLFRIPASGLRFFTVYGPWGRPDMAYYKFTDAIHAGRPIDIYNHGRMERDFTYIDEVVEAIRRLVVQPPADKASGAEPGRIDPATPHRIFNIGNHTPVRLERFVSVLEDIIGRKAERHLKPMQPGDVERTYADVEALRQAVGFTPRTTIEEGLSAFVGWYKGYHGI